MVRFTLKRSLRDDSCCKVEVMNGATGKRRFSRVETECTVYAASSLALHDHPQRHRLHPAGGETAPHFVPQQRRNLIAHQAVQHAARLLRIHQVHVHLAGLLERLGDRLLGDLVEHHAVDPRPVLLLGKLFLQVGADGFAFAVGVGRQIHILHFPGSLFELGDQLFLAFDDFVARLETVLHVDCQIPFG